MKGTSAIRRTSQAAWNGLLALAVWFSLGFTEEELLDGEAEPFSWFIENAVSLVVTAAALIGLSIWAALIVRKMRLRQAEEDTAAMQMEASVGRLLAERQTESGSSQAPPLAAPAPPAPSAATPSQDGTAFQDTQAVEAVLHKLRVGGLFAALEGVVYLSDNRSEGKIVRLVNGKSAVVLPRIEPAEFMARQLKRFDLCIVALGPDSVCVMSPLGEYIADLNAP